MHWKSHYKKNIPYQWYTLMFFMNRSLLLTYSYHFTGFEVKLNYNKCSWGFLSMRVYHMFSMEDCHCKVVKLFPSEINISRASHRFWVLDENFGASHLVLVVIHIDRSEEVKDPLLLRTPPAWPCLSCQNGISGWCRHTDPHQRDCLKHRNECTL